MTCFTCVIGRTAYFGPNNYLFAMFEPARPLAAILVSTVLAVASFSATTPEEFVKDKNTPAGAAAPAGGAPASSGGTPAATGGTEATAPKAAKPSKSAKASPAPMDTAKIHEQYLEGDFDQAIRALEQQLHSKRPLSHAESVFVYKHLGVMYAAQQSTREKGKHYMQSLIAIEPTAKILDMYASDMIHLIFRNVQEEFEAKRRLVVPAQDPAVAASAAPGTGSSPEPRPAEPVAGTQKKDSGSRKTVFLAAAGATVAVGALALFFLLGEDDPGTRVIEVSE